MKMGSVSLVYTRSSKRVKYKGEGFYKVGGHQKNHCETVTGGRGYFFGC